MANLSVQKSVRPSKFFLLLLLLLAAVATLFAVLAPSLLHSLSSTVEVGQVAAQDVLAPQAISYTSAVLTEQRRDAAAKSVLPIYTAPDMGVARQQLERLRTVLAYISSVRADTFASQEQKLGDLTALESIHLAPETATSLLQLSDARWQTVQQEAIVVLEQVMRNTVRSDRLEEALSSVPASVSLALPQDQAILVAALAASFVAPNSLYSESLTESARQKARDSITPVTRTFMTGETVVQHGQVLNPADVEALQNLGLAEPQKKWQDIVSAALLVIVMTVFMAFYLRRTPALLQNARSLLIMTFLFLLFLFTTRLTISGHAVIPYAFPLAAYGLLVSSLFGVQLALVSSLPLAILAAYGMSNSLDLTIFFIMTSLFGILALRRARRVSSFLRAGVGIALCGTLVILAFRLPMPSTDWVGLVTLTGVSIFNGLAAASLTVLLQFFLAQLLGVTTPLQLMELTRPDHVLLQTLLRDAPGTYQHSLQVANLAEQAAERIGADTLLTRVGALYHDVGKSTNPLFFIENQMPGFLNPHDDLDPAASAATIIRHVTDGLSLGRKNRLPRRLLDFIGEHHGTMLTRYQYVKAVTAAGGDESLVDESQFRYPGPRPQSRETAILMLADGCEARVRAEHPKDEQELFELIKGVIDNRLELGQLNDTDLTLHDLDVILQSFVATLRGIYHPRVRYPTLEKSVSPDETTRPIPFPAPRPASDAPVEPVSHSS